ncbi:hypothetical protein PVL29_006725 [Vitis rotundifolia]|uniref:Uncharacterized protein n=1 Tax=Vitis rotundifolia TaxID=103349 RepID=A0AA39A5R9_VITRO|nr:hypothetical protein PVL29_006725 [Vitis rotundifolia]
MVYGFIDLFSGTGDSWHWGFEMDETQISSSSHVHASKLGYGIEDKKLDKNTKPLTMQNTNQGQLHSPTVKLDALEEEIEDDSESISSSGSSRSLREELAGNVTIEKQENKDFSPEEDTAEEDDGDIESDASESLSYVSVIQDQTSHSVEKDLLMVHLLRLACASKGALADALPEITTELYNLGVSSRISQFWKPTSDFGGQSTSLPSSRYLNDFEELQPLGN